MAFQVCNGAMCQCKMGSSPAPLKVISLPSNPRPTVGILSAANIMDNKPETNVGPFGMCTSLTNPAVSVATTAALGVLTPQPCIPVITLPWAPGSPTVLIDKSPALNSSSKLMCAYGGEISITNPGQTSVQIP